MRSIGESLTEAWARALELSASLQERGLEGRDALNLGFVCGSISRVRYELRAWPDDAAVERAAEWLYLKIVGDRARNLAITGPLTWAQVKDDERGAEWRRQARTLLLLAAGLEGNGALEGSELPPSGD